MSFAEFLRGDAFAGGVDGDDAIEVDEFGLAAFLDDFELGEVDQGLFPAKFGLPVDDERLTGGELLADVGHVEPTELDLGAESVGFLKRGFEAFFPAAVGKVASFDERAAEQDRCLTGAVGKGCESAAVFVSSRVVGDEVGKGEESEFLETGGLLAGDPVELGERSGGAEEGVVGCWLLVVGMRARGAH